MGVERRVQIMNCTNKITTIARVKFKHQKLFYIVFKTLELPIQVLQ